MWYRVQQWTVIIFYNAFELQAIYASLSLIRLGLLCYHFFLMKSILICSSLEAQLLYCIKSEYNICFIHKELFSNILMYCRYLSPTLLPYTIQAVSQPSRRCNQGRLFAPTMGCFLPHRRLSVTAHTGSVLQPVCRQRSSKNKLVSYVGRRKRRKN